MRDSDVDNYMMIPRSWENRQYTKRCDCCDNGIGELEKYYEVPVSGGWETLCEECVEDHVSYSEFNTECGICGRTIREDEDCFIGDDAEIYCLDCLEEMAKINSD